MPSGLHHAAKSIALRLPPLRRLYDRALQTGVENDRLRSDLSARQRESDELRSRLTVAEDLAMRLREKDARSLKWARWKSGPDLSAAAKNFIRYLENVRDQNADVDNFPWLVYIEPTKNCNLRCPACKPAFQQPRYDNLTLQDFRNLVDEIGKYLYFVELFRAGDSFAHKDIFKMLEYLHANSSAVIQISTNGSFRWSHDQMIKIIHTVDQLDICIDGLTPATHTKYRVRSNFDLVFSNMMRLKTMIDRCNAPCILTWRFIVFKHNEHEVAQAKRIAEDLGIPILFIRAEVTGPAVDETWLPSDDTFWREEYRNPVEDSLGIERRSGPKKAVLSEPLGQEGEVDLEDTRLFSRRLPKAISGWYPGADSQFSFASLASSLSKTAPPGLGQCPWLTGGTVVTSDGILNPCCNFAADMGGLSPGLFQETYRSRFYAEARIKGICDGCNPNWVREWQDIFTIHARDVSNFLKENLSLLDADARAAVKRNDLSRMVELGLGPESTELNEIANVKSSSTYLAYGPFGAFSDHTGALWHAEAGLPQWLQVDFRDSRSVDCVRLKTPVLGNAMLRHFRLLGCEKSGRSHQLLSVEHPNSPDIYAYPLARTARFQSYRIEVLSTWGSGGYVAIERIWFDRSKRV